MRLPVPVVALALGALATGCLPKRAPGLAEHRQEAAAAGDAGLALAYDDAMLTTSWLFPHEVKAARAARRADYRQWVDAELTAWGQPDPGNVDAYLGFLLALEAEGKRGPPDRLEDLAPVVEERLRPLVRAAAEQRWREVEPLAAARKWVGAVHLAAGIATAVPENETYARRLAELRAEGARTHATLAREAVGDVPGARVLHAWFAREMGGTETLASPDDVAAFQALSGLEWSLEVQGGCELMPETLVDASVPRGTPGAAHVTVAFSGCTVDRQVTEVPKTLAYTETLEKVPVKVMKPTQVCRQTAGASTYTTNEWGYAIEVPSPTGGPTLCHTEWIETEEMPEFAQEVRRFEDYTEQRLSVRARTEGHVTVETPDGRFSVPFSFQGKSTEDDVAYETEHGGSKSYDGRAVREATDHMYEGIWGSVERALGLAKKRRADFAVASARAAVAAGRAAESEHWFFVATRLYAPHAEFVQRAGDTYGTSLEVLRAAARDEALPARSWPVPYQAADLPPVPEAVVRVEAENNHRTLQLWTREMFKMSVTGGGFGLTRPDGDPLYGALLLMSGTADTRYHRVPSYGGLLRMGLGYDTSGSNYLEMDLAVTAGVHLGRVSVTPLIGVGLDAMGLPLNSPLKEGAFPLRAAGYSEYGARVGLVWGERFPFSADLVYTKAFRAGDSILVEKRADMRFFYRNVVLGVRYTEYLDEADGFLDPFSDAHAGSAVAVTVGAGL